MLFFFVVCTITVYNIFKETGTLPGPHNGHSAVLRVGAVHTRLEVQQVIHAHVAYVLTPVTIICVSILCIHVSAFMSLFCSEYICVRM